MTVTLDDDLLQSLDARAEERGYASRSEALRDLVREALGREATAIEAGASFGVVSYVYDHGVRDLARRLTKEQHAHHELTVASLHTHVDHDTCLEVAILRGASVDVRTMTDRMISQRGVRHGHLHLIPDQRPTTRAVHSHHTRPRTKA